MQGLVTGNPYWGLHYKLSRIRNVRQTDKVHIMLVSCILLVTNTVAYYEIQTLRTHNFFTVQAG